MVRSESGAPVSDCALTVLVRVAGPPGLLLITLSIVIEKLASLVTQTTDVVPVHVVVPLLSVTLTVTAALSGMATNPASARTPEKIILFDIFILLSSS